MGNHPSSGAKWRVFRIWLLMCLIHFSLSLVAHCGVVGWYAVNPGLAVEIAEDGSRFLSLSVGLPTYPLRRLLFPPKSDANIVTTAICIPVDCCVFGLLYTWGYFAVVGFVRKNKGV